MNEDYSISLIKNFIINSFLFGEGSRLCHDTNFMETGILDSTGMIELISFIEFEFKIKINDWELIPENFSSLQKICNYLQKKSKRKCRVN